MQATGRARVYVFHVRTMPPTLSLLKAWCTVHRLRFGAAWCMVYRLCSSSWRALAPEKGTLWPTPSAAPKPAYHM